jgi:hypothetical protein
MLSEHAFRATWKTAEEDVLYLLANFAEAALELSEAAPRSGGERLVFSHGARTDEAFGNGQLAPRSMLVLVEEGAEFVPLPI